MSACGLRRAGFELRKPQPGAITARLMPSGQGRAHLGGTVILKQTGGFFWLSD